MSQEQKKILSDLAGIVQGDVFADILHRAAFSGDASIYRILPLCVVAPRDKYDISAVIKYAKDNNVPVAARGAASGVAGESLCSGIVFDMTRYMKKIIAVNNEGQTVICQPGVVLNELNDYLAKYNRKIGPDPSSGNRATIGGCVANNATGAHSLQYGYMSDYVESIESVLADASIVKFTNQCVPEQLENDKASGIVRDCLSVLANKEDVIAEALPKSKRNRSGYNIADICHDGTIDMARLLAGSEGTLAVFTEITLRTVTVPAETVLLQLEFASLEEMAKAVPIIADNGACACELMDEKLIAMALEAYPVYRDILPRKVKAVLFVEYNADNLEQAKAKIKDIDSLIGRLAVGRKTIVDKNCQQKISKARKDAVPLLNREKGYKHPIPFIEDVSVDNTRLLEYIEGITRIGETYDISMSFYGHAGDGELHIRPYLDLSKPGEIKKMLSIANDVFTLAWRLGGSISGEHADGLVRAAFIKRQYGSEFYELLYKIKKIFDPELIMNPGKIINDNPDIMAENLKAADEFITDRLKTDLVFDKDELVFELNQCSGCGVCLSKESDLRMCPVFRALGEELGSPRAKANILHFWATGQLSDEDFYSVEFKKFLSLCINCKACSLQCPAGVDISKLIIAARARYAREKGLTLAEMMLSKNRYMAVIAGFFAPISSFVMKLEPFKWCLEKLVGLDSRREMPEFKRSCFVKKGRRWLKNQPQIENPVEKVVYFVDTYANYNDHELGFAVLKVLRHNDIDVVLPNQRPAPLPAICYGNTNLAKKDFSFNVKQLIKYVRQGYKIICSEPSAALALKEELRRFVAGEDAKLISENTVELMTYLLDLFKYGELKPLSKSPNRQFLYHRPCHLMAAGNSDATIELFDKLLSIKVTDLKAGCCGLAGTFAMQKKNYELSEQISSKLRQALKESEVTDVLTECAACGMQIKHISNKRVIHPVKVLAESI